MLIKVLIIDDSAVVRKVLSTELAKDPQITVVGTALDAFVGRNKIISLQPDVVILDIEMPKVDGLSFLRRLMRYYPVPVIILSAFTPKDGPLAMEALSSGAFDVICKSENGKNLEQLGAQIIERIKAAFKKSPRRKSHPKVDEVTHRLLLGKKSEKIIAIGASTGGTEALQSVLSQLPENTPPVLIVQHMPEFFTKAFAQRLDQLCAMHVKEAEDGDILETGKVLVAPGNYHMLLCQSGPVYYVQVKTGPMVCHQRPSVDVLFNSVALVAPRRTIGVILTGMGRDGAMGMKEMKQNGAVTIAQSESTCVVFGMPKEAIDNGSVDYVVPLNDIAAKIISLC